MAYMKHPALLKIRFACGKQFLLMVTSKND